MVSKAKTYPKYDLNLLACSDLYEQYLSYLIYLLLHDSEL